MNEAAITNLILCVVFFFMGLLIFEALSRF